MSNLQEQKKILHKVTDDYFSHCDKQFNKTSVFVELLRRMQSATSEHEVMDVFSK